MSIFGKYSRHLLGVSFFFASTMATASDSEDSKLQTYLRSMDEQRKPRILIVGCGHSPKYNEEKEDHAHPDAYCVNLRTDPMLKGFPNNKAALFLKEVQYDEVLDIAAEQPPFLYGLHGKDLLLSEIPLDESVQRLTYCPPSTLKILRRRNLFDSVVLERPSNDTMQYPWTLWNATYMLKIGGEILIDSTHGYDSRTYTSKRFLDFVTVPTNSYPVNTEGEKLKRYGIPSVGFPENSCMKGMASHLVGMGFADLINVGDNSGASTLKFAAYQPFTRKVGADLESARKTSLLSGTKTQVTENTMQDWLSRIQKMLKPNPVYLKRLPVSPPLSLDPVRTLKNEGTPSPLILSTKGHPSLPHLSGTPVHSESPLSDEKPLKKNFFIKVGPLKTLPTERGDREVSLPTSRQLKKHLLQNRGSIIWSKEGNTFHMSTIWGALNNFSHLPEYGDFTVNLKFLRFIADNPMEEIHGNTPEKLYLQGVFGITYEKVKFSLFISVKSEIAYPYFVTQGLVEETKGHLKVISKVKKIKVPRRF